MNLSPSKASKGVHYEASDVILCLKDKMNLVEAVTKQQEQRAP